MDYSTREQVGHLAVAAPLVIREAVDLFSLGAPAARIFRLAACLAGIALVRGIFQYWMRVVLIGISRNMRLHLSKTGVYCPQSSSTFTRGKIADHAAG